MLDNYSVYICIFYILNISRKYLTQFPLSSFAVSAVGKEAGCNVTWCDGSSDQSLSRLETGPHAASVCRHKISLDHSLETSNSILWFYKFYVPFIIALYIFIIWAGRGHGNFYLYALILCVFGDLLSILLCIDNVGMGTFELYGLILCVSEGCPSQLLCIHNVDMETFYSHVWTQCASEGYLSAQLYIHNGNTGES